MEVWDFWLRASGSNTKLYRLYPTKSSLLHEQLLCALIKRDVADARHIIQTDPSSWLLPFLGLLQQNGLASLAWTLINQLGLHDEASSIAVSPMASKGQENREGVWYRSTLLTNLQRASGIELTRYDEFDDKFIGLLEMHQQYGSGAPELVWTKGIGLSRTLYEEPHHRLSGDFDCIVKQSEFARFVDFCKFAGYKAIKSDAGFCHQLEVGPVNSVEALFCSPAPNMVPSSVIGFEKEHWPIIDPKFNPLDRGLSFQEMERFYQNLLPVQWRQKTFMVPSLIDHLMICLVHFEKDGFDGWKSLIDIHLLAEKINAENGWNEFVRRVKHEGIKLSAWAGLSIVLDRFNSAVPEAVIVDLKPSHGVTALSLAVNPLFYWNCASLPMLCLNALVTADNERKLRVLKDVLLPSALFLQIYYGRARKIGGGALFFYLLLHWFVLLLPAIITRRTFGCLFWPKRYQYIDLKLLKSDQ